MELSKSRNAFAHSTVTIDLTQPGHLELLKKAYNEIYVPAFPNDDERENLDLWTNKLKSKSRSSADKYVIIIAGNDLDDASACFIKGISVGIYYDDAQSGLMAYNAIRPECRNEGLGRQLVDARVEALHGIAASKGHDLKGIFLEAHDPVHPCNNGYDSQKRVDKFESWGARKIDVDYIQPALAGDKGKPRDLLLMAYPVNGVYPTPGLTEEFLHALYKGHGHEPPEDDEDYCKMVADLRAQSLQPMVA